MKNKKGFGFMTSMLIAVMALFMFLALTPAIVQMFGISQGSDSLNCAGYTDPNTASLGANNKSHDAAKDTNTLGCTVVDFSPGLIIIGVVFAIIIGIITGKLGQQETQQPYNPYTGYG